MITRVATFALALAVCAGVSPAAGPTELMAAAASGDLPRVESLLAAGAVIDATDDHGTTALGHAVEHGHVKVVGGLLQAGADPRAGREATPLDIALRCCHEALVQMLSVAVDARLTRSHAQMSARIAVYQDSPPAIAAALRGGADVDDTDDVGRPLLHVAAQLGHAAALGELLDSGAYPDAVDRIGQTALMVAARLGRAALVAPLIDAGADVNHRAEPSGLAMTALHQAAAGGATAIVAALIAAGAELDATDTRGRTPLRWAVDHGMTDAAIALLEAGADATIPADDGQTVAAIVRAQSIAPLLEHL